MASDDRVSELARIVQDLTSVVEELGMRGRTTTEEREPTGVSRQHDVSNRLLRPSSPAETEGRAGASPIQNSRGPTKGASQQRREKGKGFPYRAVGGELRRRPNEEHRDQFVTKWACRLNTKAHGYAP